MVLSDNQSEFTLTNCYPPGILNSPWQILFGKLLPPLPLSETFVYQPFAPSNIGRTFAPAKPGWIGNNCRLTR